MSTCRQHGVHGAKFKALLQANSHAQFTMVTDDAAWFYVTYINSQPQPVSLAVACAELGVPAGSRYIVTEVSAARYGAQRLFAGYPSPQDQCLTLRSAHHG